jgi:selenocysteine lyase/cysteine desulfurase
LPLDRRQFLSRTGVALAAAGLLGPEALAADSGVDAAAPLGWHAIRSQFQLRRDLVHLGSFLLASHPAPVRRAIEYHRRQFDADPVSYLHSEETTMEAAVLRAAAAYTGARPQDIALTDSTTMGLSLIYNGIDLREGQEALTSTHDFFVTHDALQLKAGRTGASVRKIALYDNPAAANADEIVRRIVANIRSNTRVLALTWVHSSTGVKLPVRKIADALGGVNAGRSEADRVLFCVDGVHGFGNQNVRLPDLGCDFFSAGCHKWLFGPRGTGIVWGGPRSWQHMTVTIPSFTDTGTSGSQMTPGGFHSFEHRWALAQAFRFLSRIGKARVQARTQTLNRQLKAGLAAMRHVTLYTPRSDALSAGLVVFDVHGMAPRDVLSFLLARSIIATETPYTPSHARVAASILNTPAEVQRTLRAIRGMA